MKRTIIVVSTLITLMFVCVNFVCAETKVVVKEILTINIDKSIVRTDVPPINVQGQTLVPVRGIFNAFGAEIGWFPIEKRVFIRQDSQVIWLQIGVAQATINEAIVPLQVPAQIYRGRTMVPLRFISEALGATVNWNPNTQTITIITRSQATPVPTRPNLPPPETVTPPGETVTPPSTTPTYPNDQNPAPD